MTRPTRSIAVVAATLGIAVAAPSFAQGDAQAQIKQAQDTLTKIITLIDSINARNGSGGAPQAAQPAPGRRNRARRARPARP